LNPDRKKIRIREAEVPTMNGLKKVYADYPRLFWVVVGTHFIDGLGSTLLFPFFATISPKVQRRYDRSGLYSYVLLVWLVCSMVGGALTDRFDAM